MKTENGITKLIGLVQLGEVHDYMNALKTGTYVHI